MTFRRLALAGTLLVLFATLAASCGNVSNPQGWASPVVDGSTTYLFTKKDRLAAVKFTADGPASETWHFPDKNKQPQKGLKLEAVYTSPVLDGDRLYVGTYSGEVLAIATKDGELLKRNNQITGSIVGGPVLAGDLLLFGTTEGRFYALNKLDLQTAPGWPVGGIPFTDGIWAAPAVANGVAYVASMHGEVRAIRLADRSDAWPEPFKVAGAVAALQLLDDARLFVPGLNRKVSIVDTATGKATIPAFQASDWVWTRAAFKDNTAYFGDFSGKTYALDITTGQAKWTYSANKKVKGGPALLDNVLVLADRGPVVHFVDAQTGGMLNSVPLTGVGTVRADVIADGATALVVTTGGKLFRADPKTRSVPEVLLPGAGQ